jgi:hypothetical protein
MQKFSALGAEMKKKSLTDGRTDGLNSAHFLKMCPSLIEPFLDYPTLFSLKRLPSGALIFYSGVFWSAPDHSFGGYFLEINP